MLGPFKSETECSFLSKTVQDRGTDRKEIPHGAMLLDTLKAMETQLQSKGFLKKTKQLPFYPLWFIAETERNAYLWRSGHSLAEQNLFEFWIDIEKLISKRLVQLSLGDIAHESATSASGERQYLLAFQGITRKIESHAHALSCIRLLIEKEVLPSTEERAAVVLPAACSEQEEDDE